VILDLHGIFLFLTLCFLEIVLALDNLVFLSILTHRLPIEVRQHARHWGLFFAVFTRLSLLGVLNGLAHSDGVLFHFGKNAVTVRAVILILGGIFLIWKAIVELYQDIGGWAKKQYTHAAGALHTFWGVVVQIGLMDIIFSLDSVFTAVAITDRYWMMASAIVLAAMLMVMASGPLSRLIENYPRLKTLALGFLIIIGGILIAEGFEYSVDKRYLYVVLLFSVWSEWMNYLKEDRKN
jgi:predicted tellurium resistance membrane protein TerC